LLVGLAILVAACGGSVDDADPTADPTAVTSGAESASGSITPVVDLMYEPSNGDLQTFPADADTLAWCGPLDDGGVGLTAILGVVGRESDLPGLFLTHAEGDSLVFFLDGATGGEYSSDEEGTSGSVEFAGEPCVDTASGDAMTVMLDMTLGSENGNGASIQLRGTATIEIGDEPPE